MYWKIQYFIYALRSPDFQKIFLFARIGHLKKIIFKGRGFRCGSDEKMRRMWLGLGIVVVALPPTIYLRLVSWHTQPLNRFILQLSWAEVDKLYIVTEFLCLLIKDKKKGYLELYMGLWDNPSRLSPFMCSIFN